MTQFLQPTLVTLTSPTCSGKSFLLDALVKGGVVDRIVSTTTRPPRAGEEEGRDYYFISKTKSVEMEKDSKFFELVEFNAIRYGVTFGEMKQKMSSALSPAVVLEPNGVEIYQKRCQENGWAMFKIYVSVPETDRLNRLFDRTLKNIHREINAKIGSRPEGKHGSTFHEIAVESLKSSIAPHLFEHHKRVISSLGDERRWINLFNWDLVVPGDNIEKAVEMVKQGIAWRNRKISKGMG